MTEDLENRLVFTVDSFFKLYKDFMELEFFEEEEFKERVLEIDKNFIELLEEFDKEENKEEMELAMELLANISYSMEQLKSTI